MLKTSTIRAKKEKLKLYCILQNVILKYLCNAMRLFVITLLLDTLRLLDTGRRFRNGELLGDYNFVGRSKLS